MSLRILEKARGFELFQEEQSLQSKGIELNHEQMVPGTAAKFLEAPLKEAEHRRAMEERVVNEKVRALPLPPALLAIEHLRPQLLLFQ